MKKIAIIGAEGQLGAQCAAAYRGRDETATYTFPHGALDITDRKQLRAVLDDLRPAVIINAAALRDIDACEADQERAFEINAFGASNVAMAADRLDAVLVHISCDQVLGPEDASRDHGCREDEPVHPVNEYGRSKADAEKFVKSLCNRYYICRTGWLFGPPGTGGDCMLAAGRTLRTEGRLQAVNDQRGSPSYAPHVARKIAWIVDTLPYGIYHVANHGIATWFDCVTAVREILHLEAEIVPAAGADIHHHAPRPRFCALDNFNLRLNGADDLPPWREALAEHLAKFGM